MDRNKFDLPLQVRGPESLSARRAWIEIWARHRDAPRKWVALRKESVDRNLCRLVYMLEGTGRSPQGERG